MDVKKIYHNLKKRYGPQGWWPLYISDPDLKSFRIEHGLTYGISYDDLKNYYKSYRDPYFEIATGAILAQNVSWKNAAAAIYNLYRLKALNPKNILELSPAKMNIALIPSRFYAQKARKLKLFSKWLLDNQEGNILNLKKYHPNEIRTLLLDQWGIGKETADSIMLYSLNIPMFVIDTYTKRLCIRHKIEFREYDQYREFFENGFKTAKNKVLLAKIYQEFHALIVISEQAIEQ